MAFNKDVYQIHIDRSVWAASNEFRGFVPQHQPLATSDLSCVAFIGVRGPQPIVAPRSGVERIKG